MAIGYKSPPKATQFRKGTSGNPRGRPKGSKNFMTLLEQELSEPIVVNEDGRRKKVTRMQAMVKRMVAGALQGDQKSLLTLIEVMRKTGQLQQAEQPTALPDDYQEILDTYIQRRINGKSKS
ncbi:DUF5681 domain-containing protein [Variovorax sp. VNK109]|uniref:DUF5681 domain-containing protein n=1 Tax=Variovorax sp. VNK109 TaxID=3400919 RepID=UPI003C0104D6